jgi:predicted nucleic acid-binding protein
MEGMGTDILETMGLDVGDQVLLDASALIAYMEGEGRAKAAMDAIVDIAGSGMLKLRASAIVWTELLRAPASAEIALAYRGFLSDSTRIVIVPVDVAIAYAAAGMLAGQDRRRGSGKGDAPTSSGGEPGPQPFLADALHLATAVVGRCKAVVTNDEAWKQAAPRNLRVIILDELAAAYSL